MGTVVNMAHAGHVRQGCNRINARFGLCADLARQVVDCGMHALRLGAKPGDAIKAARQRASVLARLSSAFRPTEPAA